MSKKGIFLSIFLETTKFGHQKQFFLQQILVMFFIAIQDKNKMFSKKFCLANFRHILGHMTIVVFQNDVFGPSKILTVCPGSS